MSGNVSGWLDQGGTFTKHLLMSHAAVRKVEDWFTNIIISPGRLEPGGILVGGGLPQWSLATGRLTTCLVYTDQDMKQMAKGDILLVGLPGSHWSAGRLTTCSGYFDAGFLVATGQLEH